MADFKKQNEERNIEITGNFERIDKIIESDLKIECVKVPIM